MQQVNSKGNLIAADLDHIINHTDGLWEELRGKNIFITGGTGFFGCWFLESFLWANKKFGLGATMLVLTRDEDDFKRRMPHLFADKSIKCHSGDIRDFVFPSGEFSYVIHAAATSALATFNQEDQLIKFDTVISGTRHALDFAVYCRAKKFLYTSSGAVYGRQNSNSNGINEDCPDSLDSTDISSVWGISKRAAELLCTCYSDKYGIESKIARCFSFIGPYLPLDLHYAAGNFIGDVIASRPINVKGDGTSFRSYLYASDLMIWLWTILLKGKTGQAYNVGSEEAVSIADLAGIVARISDSKVNMHSIFAVDSNNSPDRYFPSTKKAQTELGLRQFIGLEEAIGKTIDYYQSKLV